MASKSLACFEKKNFENIPFFNIAHGPPGPRLPRVCAGCAARGDYRLCETVLERPLGGRASFRGCLGTNGHAWPPPWRTSSTFVFSSFRAFTSCRQLWGNSSWAMFERHPGKIGESAKPRKYENTKAEDFEPKPAKGTKRIARAFRAQVGLSGSTRKTIRPRRSRSSPVASSNSIGPLG